MNLIIYLLIGFIVGIGVMILVMKRKMAEIMKLAPESEDEQKKKENLVKVENYIINKVKFTNDELQHLLKVSDTTIGRYLQELEEQGKIRQVGKTGKAVYYEKI